MFEWGANPFGLDVKPSSEQVDWTFFDVYTDEENFDCHKENPMMTCVRVRAETQPDCTGVAETPYFCMGVAEMPSVCTGVVERPPDRNIVGGNLSYVQKKHSVLMITSGKDTF